MAKLSVNIDHVATLREARKGKEPDPIAAAILVELAGAHGITVHLREDRRHIQDRDVKLLRQIVTTSLNLEMAATEAMTQFAIDILPHQVTLVPESRQELTTEGGLNVVSNLEVVGKTIQALHKHRILVSLFIDPEINQVKASQKLRADAVEFHTGTFCNAYNRDKNNDEWQLELEKLEKMTQLARKLGLTVNMGHGIDYQNIECLKKISDIDHFSIGHSIISRAVLVGMEKAVREMREAIN